MSRITKLYVALGALAVLSGCAAVQEKAADPAEKAGVAIYFYEALPGQSEPRLVHMFVHKDFIHFGPVNHPENYTLFRRTTKTIYEVDGEQKTIKEISGQRAPADLTQYRIESETNPSKLLTDTEANHLRIKVNGETCFNVIGVQDMLPEVREALREYYSVKANDPAFDALAEGGCARFINVAAPEKRVEVGFPARQWGSDGYSLFIQEYRVNIIPSDDLNFNTLPEWYKK
ncbi:MAG: hypothetical protein AB1810_12400 [Pseudomonadota bacterium]